MKDYKKVSVKIFKIISMLHLAENYRNFVKNGTRIIMFIYKNLGELLG